MDNADGESVGWVSDVSRARTPRTLRLHPELLIFPHMRAKGRGVTHGRVLRCIDLGGARLTETAHGPSTVLGKHSHPHPALTFVLAGGFIEAFGPRKFDCSQLSILVKPAFADHNNKYGSAGARSLIVEVIPAATSDTILALEEHGPRLVPAAVVPCMLRLYGSFRAMQNGVSSDTLLPDLEELLQRSRPEADGRPREDCARPGWLGRAIDRLHACCEEPHSLSTLARDAGVHPVHFARVFRRRTGASVGQYLRRLRIERAVRELGTGRNRVSALAHGLGFSDQSHFTRAFRTATGTTPAAFRHKASIVLARG